MGSTLDIAAFTDAFLRFEVAHDLFAVTVRGESLWEHLRYSVFSECIYAHHGYVEPKMPRVHPNHRELVEAGRAGMGLAAAAAVVVNPENDFAVDSLSD